MFSTMSHMGSLCNSFIIFLICRIYRHIISESHYSVGRSRSNKFLEGEKFYKTYFYQHSEAEARLNDI
jgi:predicted metal-dependent HD superfamily phosphohydrolase